jgi:transcriptional regulator GlxA family with amidase domain
MLEWKAVQNLSNNGAMVVGILVFDDVEELDFAGPWEVFGIASGLKNLKVLTVSKDGKSIQCRYGLKVQPDYSFANCPKLDLLIVPGGRGARVKVRYDAESIAFIQRHASQGATASVCTGALILAQAGLLDEKRATTHSSLLNLLREYPKVQVIENIRFIFQGNVATSAGITAGIDLSLELLKRTYDDQLVGEIVKEMEYRR